MGGSGRSLRVLVALGCFVCTRAFAVDGALIEISGGPYAPLLTEQLKHWPPRGLSAKPSEAPDAVPVEIECYETEGNETLIGTRQLMWIRAPLEAVVGVNEDFDHYKDIFPGYEDVHVVAREGNRIDTYWEQYIPIFFIPNVKYEISYFVEPRRKGRVAYRYQHKSGKDVKFNDGLIVLESFGPKLTRFVEYDFYDADWGILKSFGAERIWKTALESVFQSNAGLLLRVERPELSFKQLREEADRLLEKYPPMDCWKKRVRWKGYK